MSASPHKEDAENADTERSSRGQRDVNTVADGHASKEQSPEPSSLSPHQHEDPNEEDQPQQPTGQEDSEMQGHPAQDQSLYETEVKEQDRWLPIANVARIMKTALPENAKIAKEAKECMQECVSEFISFITSEASEKCQQEKRKTVNGEDIIFAMTSLGFENYSEALRIYLVRYRETNISKSDGQQQGQVRPSSGYGGAPGAHLGLDAVAAPVAAQTLNSTRETGLSESDPNTVIGGALNVPGPQPSTAPVPYSIANETERSAYPYPNGVTNGNVRSQY